MRLLLDTQIVLWQLSGARKLTPEAADAIRAAEELRFSVVSFAEVGIKAAIGKLKVPDQFHERVQEAGAETLGLAPEHGLRIAELPLHHRDPFDRLLIAQALCEGLTILTSDVRFNDYEVPLVIATAAA